MSHRAIIAEQTAPDSYDLYYSANGADDLYLTEHLENYAAGRINELHTLSKSQQKQVPHLKQWIANETSHEDSGMKTVMCDAAKPAIDPTPIHSGIPLEKIAYPIDFDTIEAVYLVRNGTVETYVPVWMEPNIICPWRDYLTVEVYRAGTLTGHPSELFDELTAADPVRVIDGETFTSPGWLDDTLVEDVVRKTHEAVYALQRQAVTTNWADNDQTLTKTGESGDVKALLSTDAYHLWIQSSSTEELTPSPTGRGLLIRVPNGNTSKYWNVVDKANRVRLETGGRLHMPSAIDEADLCSEMTNLTKQLLEVYHDRVASFSPPPFGSLATRLGTGCDSN